MPWSVEKYRRLRIYAQAAAVFLLQPCKAALPFFPVKFTKVVVDVQECHNASRLAHLLPPRVTMTEHSLSRGDRIYPPKATLKTTRPSPLERRFNGLTPKCLFHANTRNLRLSGTV